MLLTAKDIILRDFIEEDIEKRISWETTETEWQLWDGPWEYEGLTEAEKETNLKKYIEQMHQWVEYYKSLPDEQFRRTFQIVTNDAEKRYIGWVNSYQIDSDYNFTKADGCRAVGIDIPDLAARGKGYSYQALSSFICYLHSHGEKEIYTQTWSGNERVFHIVERLGFEECCRKKDFRTVRGKKYDGLTFRLNQEKFSEWMLDEREHDEQK